MFSITQRKSERTSIQTRKRQLGHRSISLSKVLWPSSNRGTSSWKTQRQCFQLRRSAVILHKSACCERVEQCRILASTISLGVDIWFEAFDCNADGEQLVKVQSYIYHTGGKKKMTFINNVTDLLNHPNNLITHPTTSKK